MDKRPLLFAALGLAVLLTSVTATAQSAAEGVLWENRHVTRHVKAYDGPKTCIECHDAEAADVFKSIHYQWKAATPNLSNGGGRLLGKLNSTNDFCTNPSVSWISILANDEGKVIGNGCSKCHVGLGVKPSPEMTQAQLENIDCLICHSANYRREVAKKPDGSLAWQPRALANPAQMLSIAQNVTKPSNEMCMRCHVGSGGGLNFKRGDLETAHIRADRDFDVHIGANMQCIQCHKFRNHQVQGAGTQMAGSEGEARPQCESCHKGKLHARAENDKHARRVACTTCHIATFARHDRTDVRRDWSHAEAVTGEGRFEPKIEFATNVKPVYAWWNGTGRVALLDEPVRPGANGKVGMYTPNGSRKDPKARIYAFKYHTAKIPIDNATRMMVPVQVGPVFKSGKVEAGVRGGAKAWLGREVGEIGWIETERYMGIFHEVQPREKALACKDCHEGGQRMDWKALGYSGDPARGKQLARR